jgi:hypothetical protein
MRRTAVVGAVLCAFCALAVSAGAKVLRVGSLHGVRGQFTSVQAAVNVAKPGDWILIGPGDYKTTQIRTPKGAPNFPAGVLVTTRNLHIRGMSRSKVIVDGTRLGSSVCSNKPSAQNFGLKGASGESSYAVPAAAAAAAGKASGVNGLMVWKAPNVSIENLTACNFLGGARDAGNEIWWNGGANSGKVGGHGFYGAYLTTTSTYLKGKSAADEFSAAKYGVFSSNWSGGTWDNIYGSNFNDSGFYIGACRQVCDQTVDHGWAQYNALGYSGSNSGGRLVIENSQFDHNEDGFDTNSQNGDNPPPQNGDCPGNGISSITHTHSCWVFIHNYVHDNNNPNVPAAGLAAAGPVGTGMSVSGARDDTIMDNRFVNNNAWGVIFVAYPDQGPPCTGGTLNFPLLGKGGCLYDDWGNALVNNVFDHNGGYGNPTNGDFGELNLEPGHPTSCYSGNTQPGGGTVTSSPADLQQSNPTCDGSAAPANMNTPFLSEVYCDSQLDVALCKPTDHYPRVTKIVMHKLPTSQLKSMPNPCADVPSNPWCKKT